MTPLLLRSFPALLLGGLLLSGCLRHGTCAEEPDNRFCRDAGRTDGGTARPIRDAAPDTGPDTPDAAPSDAAADASVDAGLCGGACADGAFCVEGADGGLCVGCRDTGDCAAPTPVCHSVDRMCVGCEEASDCASVAGRPICSDGACVECATDADCADNPNGAICTDGLTCGCVEDGDCAAPAECRPDDGVCGGTPACEVCTADTDCLPSHDCVAMEFPEGTPRGTYCLPRATGVNCILQRPYNVLDARMSVGGREGSYCTLDEENTTCEALLDIGRGLCPGGDTSGCQDGAICRSDACTIRCSAETSCPLVGTGTDCVSNQYCGTE